MVAWPTTGSSEGTWNDEMKTYVDVEHNSDGTHKNTTGNTPTLLDTDANAMLKDHAYLASTAGFVTAFLLNSANANFKAFVGTTNDPAGAGQQMGQAQSSDATHDATISFFVPDTKFFEITSTTGTPTITWTALLASGGAPVDQD